MAKLNEKIRRLDWGNHLLNFVGTCLGVLLALYLTNYQEDQRDQRRLRLAMQNITAEIKNNYENTKKHLDEVNNQLKAIEALRPLINAQDSLVGTEAQVNAVKKEFPEIFSAEKRTSLGNGLYNWRASLNLNAAFLDLSDIAWKNAQAMDVLHLVDFENANELYSLYSFQYQVLSDVEKAFNIIKNAFTSDKSGLEIILKDYKSQLTLARDFEKALIAYYPEVLKQLKKKTKQ